MGQHGNEGSQASDILYIKALAAPFTVNTMPEATLKALAGHNDLGAILPADGGDCEEVLAQFAKAGIDVDALAAQLQDEGAKSFVKSWNDLMAVIRPSRRVKRLRQLNACYSPLRSNAEPQSSSQNGRPL